MKQIGSSFPSKIRRLGLALFVGFACLAPTTPSLQAAEEERKPELSERVAQRLDGLQELLNKAFDSKDWTEAFATVSSIMEMCRPGSYDEFYLSPIMAQVYIGRGGPGDFAKAIPLLERVANSQYFEPKRYSDVVFNVAQLYLQQENLAKSEEYARRFLEVAPRIVPERVLFFCSVVLTRADPGGGKPIDRKAVEEVIKKADWGLRMNVKPDERLLLIKAAAFIALDRSQEAAETLELLVSLNPTSKQYWEQLASRYMVMQRDLRGILAIERAQSHGLLNTPRENGVLVNLYYNLGAYLKAAELLENGLNSGKIEKEARNYETWAFCYQQANRELQAIEVYKEASKVFPDTGKYDSLISNMYYGLGRTADAFEWAAKAITKPGLEKPAQMIMFAAFLAYDLERYDAARGFLDKAEPLITTEREKNDYDNLRRAVTQAQAAQRSAQEQARS